MAKSTNIDNFHLDELNALRRDVEYRMTEQAQTERYVVIGVSAVYAGLAAVTPGQLANLPPAISALHVYFWWLPFLVVIAGAARFWDNHFVIQEIRSYIALREKTFDAGSGSWECYHPGHMGQRSFVARAPWQVRKFSWCILFLLTLVVAAISTFSGLQGA